MADLNEDDDTTLFGEVNVDYVSRQVWLVKLPEFLATDWSSREPDSDLGTVKIGSGGQIKIVTKPSAANPIPQEYSLLLQLPPPDNPLFVFSETTDGVLNMEGTVGRKGLAKPMELNPDYRALCKERVMKANTKTRHVEPLDEHVMPQTRRPVDSIFSKNKAKKDEKVSRRAEERMSKEQLRQQIFIAFERVNYLSLKSLQQATNQPAQWIKDVAGEVCVYNKRGPNKTMFELKPEYKKKGAAAV